ncbi:MAG: efflux RND transporter permease subunit [Thermoplasmatota archaeon]
MKRKKSRKFSLFPSIISNNPKKVIVVILVFTLIMGYFASQIEMGTEQESFNPDTPKAEYLDQIRFNFGSSEEVIQIAFVSEEGNVFKKEVLQDMLDIKRALRESKKVNATLLTSNDVTRGMNTLADIILTADQAFSVEDTIIQYSEKTEGMFKNLENQKQMYSYMNKSLTPSKHILEDIDPITNPITYQSTTGSLVSMSHIISNPSLWRVMHQYSEDFDQLLELMEQDLSLVRISTIILETDKLIEKVEEESLPGSESFVGLLTGMNNILEYSSNPYHIEFSVEMTSEFLKIGYLPIEYNQSINEDENEMKIPSFELSEKEKRERLKNMSDEDIKNLVRDVIQYESDDLNNAVNTTLANFQNMIDVSRENIQILQNVNETLTQINKKLQEDGQIESAYQLGLYQRSVIINKTIMEYSIPSFEEYGSQFRSSTFIANIFRNLDQGIRLSVSKDFKENVGIHDIRAKSAISLLQMNSSLSRDTRLEAQKEIIEISSREARYSNIKVIAQQVMMEEINESADDSLNTLLPIAFLFVVIILFIVYRSVAETTVSLLSLGMAIVWTFGIGVLLEYEFNPLLIAVPILITGLVIDYGIHMVMRIREEKDSNNKSPKVATVIAITTVGGALLLTTLTTAIGFLSNILSSIQVMEHFAILAAVGILSSFVLMVFFLPAIVQIMEEWRKGKKDKKQKVAKKVKQQGNDFISKILSSSADASDRHPWIVLFIVLMITLASVYGVVNIDTTFNIQDFLPEDKPQSQNIKYIGENFNISTSYAYILTEGELDTSEYLYALDSTSKNLKGSEMLLTEEGMRSPLHVVQKYGTASPGSENYNLTIVEEFSNSDTNGDSIPNQNITYLYDILFEAPESSEDIKNVLVRNSDGTYTTGVITAKENANKLTKNIDNAKIMEKDMTEASRHLRDEGIKTKITSSNIIAQETTEELSSTQIRSLIITIITVCIILSIVFHYLHKSLFLGVITTLPVTVVTLWIVGTMYLMDVPLNVMTVSITALTVGMGVDYSIHITHRFTEEIKDEERLYDAVHDTVQHTGAALFGSAATTIGAFGILSTSDILPLSQFGYITALAIGYSFLVAVFVLPSGLMVWAKYNAEKLTLEKKRKSYGELPTLKKRRSKPKRIPILKKRPKKKKNVPVLRRKEN